MKDKLKVSAISKKQGSYQVVLSNKEIIILCGEVLKKHQLKRGSELSVQFLKEIVAESDFIRAENYCSYLLAKREYSSGMLRNKLFGKGYDIEISKAVISKLRRVSLVDDRRFARLAVETIIRNRPAGRGYLIAYLKSKYISRDMAETVVDEFMENVDEKDLAEKLLRSRFRQYFKFDLETARRKAYNYLSRRAISYGASKFAFEKICKEEKLFSEEPED